MRAACVLDSPERDRLTELASILARGISRCPAIRPTAAPGPSVPPINPSKSALSDLERSHATALSVITTVNGDESDVLRAEISPQSAEESSWL